jgi:uncharacterized lipoprotein NlpE involved in copper resistance
MLALAAALVACMPRQDAAMPDPAHNSRNAVDWAGTYEGITPCADCPGIKTRLTLQPDGRYELSTQYLERQVAPQTARGQFSWNAAGSAITLDTAGHGQQFQVGEGRLLQLNQDGSSPGWNATHRVLTMQKPK